MLRFLIRNKIKMSYNGYEGERFCIIDCEVPELEELLKNGGYGEDSYDYSNLIGVEILFKDVNTKDKEI